MDDTTPRWVGAGRSLNHLVHMDSVGGMAWCSQKVIKFQLIQLKIFQDF